MREMDRGAQASRAHRVDPEQTLLKAMKGDTSLCGQDLDSCLASIATKRPEHLLSELARLPSLLLVWGAQVNHEQKVVATVRHGLLLRGEEEQSYSGHSPAEPASEFASAMFSALNPDLPNESSKLIQIRDPNQLRMIPDDGHTGMYTLGRICGACLNYDAQLVQTTAHFLNEVGSHHQIEFQLAENEARVILPSAFVPFLQGLRDHFRVAAPSVEVLEELLPSLKKIAAADEYYLAWGGRSVLRQLIASSWAHFDHVFIDYLESAQRSEREIDGFLKGRCGLRLGDVPWHELPRSAPFIAAITGGKIQRLSAAFAELDESYLVGPLTSMRELELHAGLQHLKLYGYNVSQLERVVIGWLRQESESLDEGRGLSSLVDERCAEEALRALGGIHAPITDEELVISLAERVETGGPLEHQCATLLAGLAPQDAARVGCLLESILQSCSSPQSLAELARCHSVVRRLVSLGVSPELSELNFSSFLDSEYSPTSSYFTGLSVEAAVYDSGWAAECLEEDELAAIGEILEVSLQSTDSFSREDVQRARELLRQRLASDLLSLLLKQGDWQQSFRLFREHWSAFSDSCKSDMVSALLSNPKATLDDARALVRFLEPYISADSDLSTTVYRETMQVVSARVRRWMKDQASDEAR